MRYLKTALSILLIIIFSYYLIFPEQLLLLNNLNFLIHEAGHLITSPLGEFISVLGGTLFQLAIPSLFVGYFFQKKDYYAGSVLLFWLAQNIMNVSIYMSDALDMKLQLFGGENVVHDWNYILEKLNLLFYTDILAGITKTLSVVLTGVASFLTLKFSVGEKEDPIHQNTNSVLK